MLEHIKEVWTFINPLCQIIVYIIVFSVIVRTDLDRFYVYVITGMIPWFFFDGALRQGAGCVRYQGDMVKKIYFPREVLPIACVTSNFVNMLFCFVMVFAVLVFSDIGISVKALFPSGDNDRGIYPGTGFDRICRYGLF